MDCGELVALSVMVTDAATEPIAVGAKCPWMVQLAPIARLVPQLLANTNEDASVPVTATLVIINAAVPVLVMITDWDPLDVPTVVEGYERLVAESVTGPDGGTPVPLKVIDCGDVPALSVMVKAAFNAPVAVGAKCPWIVQLALAGRLVPHVLPNTNEEAFAPVTAMLLIDNAAIPLLVSVTDCDPLDVPSFTEPYERLVAERVTGGSTPIPLNAIDCGELLALSVMVTAAFNAPAAAGAKCPWMMQLAPPATLAPQVLPKTNEEASLPVNAMLVIDRAAPPVLVSVTCCEPLTAPTASNP